MTTEGTEYPITIESTGTGQAWTDVSRAAPGTPITVYTQGGTVKASQPQTAMELQLIFQRQKKCA